MVPKTICPSLANSVIYPKQKTPWGAKRSTPALGRATFTPIVLRRRVRGGLHCPSPSPRGFPHYKDKAVGFAPPVAALPPPQSLHQPLKGGGTAPGRSRGPSGRKKRKRPCLRFFLFKAASCRPAPNPPHRGVLCPPGFSVFQQANRASPAAVAEQ